jgi:hypothetical protein
VRYEGVCELMLVGIRLGGTMMGAVMFWKGASEGCVGSSGEGLLDEEPMVRELTMDCLQEGWSMAGGR